VTADPDVEHYDRRQGDEYLVLASDGLWNVLTNQDVSCIIQLVLSELAAVGLLRQQISALLPKLLTRIAMQRGSTDNVTVITLDISQNNSSSSRSKLIAQQQIADVQQHRSESVVVADDVQVCKDPSPANGNDKTGSAGITISQAALQRIRCIIQLVSSSSWDSSKTAAALKAGRKLQQLPAVAASELASSVPSTCDGQPGGLMHAAAAGIAQTGVLLQQASAGLQEFIKSCSSVGQQPQTNSSRPQGNDTSDNTKTQNCSAPHQKTTTGQRAGVSPVGSCFMSPFEVAQQQEASPHAFHLCGSQRSGSIASDCSPFSVLSNIISSNSLSSKIGSPVGTRDPQGDQLAESAKKRRLVTTGSGDQPLPAAVQLCSVGSVHSMQPPSKVQRVDSVSVEVVGAQSSAPVLRVVQPLSSWSLQDSTWIAMRASA
jgi:hypothetical protein